MADYRLGIDFGTSTTVACLRWPDGRTRPMLFDGSPLLPSAVFLADDGRLLVGRDAQHSARVDPARFEPNPKQRIDEGTVLLGSTEVPVTALIAEVLRRVAIEASTVAGGAPLDVTIACPAAWGEHRKRTLLDAAAAAGLREPRLVPEPIAAASYFDAVVRDRNRPPGNLVVYDLGAGTFDVSVVARATGGFEVRVTDGLADIGGLDIDAAIIGFLGAVVENAESVWARLEQPTTTQDRRARRQLWDDVRTAKEMLSRSATTIIFVPLLEQDLPLGRAQFERLVRPLLERTVATTKSSIRRAALPESVPLDVFLVGGASRVPLIATLLHRALGVAPTAIEQPELAVAEGCLADDPAGSAQPAGVAGPAGSAWPAGPTPAPVSGGGPAAAPVSGPSGQFPAQPYSPVSPGYGATQYAPVSAPAGYGPPAPAYGPAPPGYNSAPAAYTPVGPPGYHPAQPPAYGPARVVGPPGQPQYMPLQQQPPWTSLVQVLDLAIGESAGFTLRCYLPAEDPDEDPDAAFLTVDGQMLVFDDLPEMVNYLRGPDQHDLTDLADWHLVQHSIDAATAERYTVEAYELDLIVANIGHGTKEWSPDLLVAARDLAVELGNALDLRPVLAPFGRGNLLDQLDDTMRAHRGRRSGQWWKDRRLNGDEVQTIRDTWRRVVTILEAAIWPNVGR
ncbi:Hsp70 family protein [Virgisporangium aurantiacum]|uniref:Hsp70 protein n=1 Tax=Virgisporangium aurantiacum TaxID=175570 RepID=A0A8J3Z146_9ACTN|nr:Hsp70 family protein [Virgisporangium aurantiacum]GIJ53400.1 hypothetical protein Vau01_009160 [Virgisporangium aurantiacum]